MNPLHQALLERRAADAFAVQHKFQAWDEIVSNVAAARRRCGGASATESTPMTVQPLLHGRARPPQVVPYTQLAPTDSSDEPHVWPWMANRSEDVHDGKSSRIGGYTPFHAAKGEQRLRLDRDDDLTWLYDDDQVHVVEQWEMGGALLRPTHQTWLDGTPAGRAAPVWRHTAAATMGMSITRHAWRPALDAEHSNQVWSRAASPSHESTSTPSSARTPHG